MVGVGEESSRAAAEAEWVSSGRGLPVLLVAGDQGHSRRVSGQSKAFVKIGGRSMLEHVLETLLHTPEVAEVYVVGDATRVQQTLAGSGLLELAAARGRPVHVLPQRATLYDNVWYGFLATLPPGDADPDREVLVVPADIPLAIPEEISLFVRQARAVDQDYVLGLTPDFALEPFAPRDGRPGIEMACFNLAEGRFRQNNLHLVRPLRIANRHYIQDMYESRYQKELGSILRLALQVLVREYRNLWVLLPYLVLHLAGALDRRGHVRSSAFVRSWVSLRTVEACASRLLRTRFRTVTTALGGAALDVDNESDLEAADKMLSTWRAMQQERARAMLPAEIEKPTLA